MQLILDTDNIDIERNMSTIEQEVLNEKFLTNKAIDHLADDIVTGNKENILKQDNIIPDLVEDNVLDTDKEIIFSGDEILTDNFNEDISKRTAVDSENVQTSDNDIEDDSTKTNPEQQLDALIIKDEDTKTIPEQQRDTLIIEDEDTETNPEQQISTLVIKDEDTKTNAEQQLDSLIIEDESMNINSEHQSDVLTIENVGKEESPVEKADVTSKELQNTNSTKTDMIKENETDLAILITNAIVDDPVTIKKTDVAEISTELIEDNEMDLDKEVDISELSTELNEEKEKNLDKEVDILEISSTLNKDNVMDLDKEVDILEVSSALKKNNEMDLDKEIDVTEGSTALNKDNDIEIEDTLDTVTEKELRNESVHSDLPNTVLDHKTQEEECSEIDVTHIPNNVANETNTAIEIDDEDERSNENNTESDPKLHQIQESVENKDQPELIEKDNKSTQEDTSTKNTSEEPTEPKRICRLSNNLDIFSDEEEDRPDLEQSNDNIPPSTEKQCISIDDDDDIMLIDEVSSTKEHNTKDSSIEVDTTSACNNTHSIPENTNQPSDEINQIIESKQDTETIEETLSTTKENKEIIEPTNETADVPVDETPNTAIDKSEESEQIKKPLLPKNFVNTCKKNLSDMTRNDLEEFCILKIVESIVDRSNLGEIKAHLKNLTQTMEECKKKCLMLTKQNKDLQFVLKSVQEEQKSGSDVHITPLKIIRSVGMQVVMVADKNNQRKKPINGAGSQPPVPNNNAKQVKNQQIQNARNQKEKPVTTPQIPVPRLVPATSPTVKANQAAAVNTAPKQVNNAGLPNGVRNSPPVQKIAEKRVRSQAVTVDLTDDEPPAKLQNVQRGPINQPMRVLTTTPNLIPAQRFNQNMNSPRKVYIPISGPQAQNVRPGQTIMLKTFPGLGPRPRGQTQALIAKAPQTATAPRFGRGQPSRHPAPLPDAMKQYQPPNWKSLPPAPDLKLSKVENGIVISWKIDGYQEENHEEIASYQLYAYQETSSPPNTALWKKIGDVKALPLPMACTLTQFMAGYKYYFAVRAVDVRSRFGPFSLPGSILLLNKM